MIEEHDHEEYAYEHNEHFTMFLFTIFIAACIAALMLMLYDGYYLQPFPPEGYEEVCIENVCDVEEKCSHFPHIYSKCVDVFEEDCCTEYALRRAP